MDQDRSESGCSSVPIDPLVGRLRSWVGGATEVGLMMDAAREIERLNMALTAIIEYDTRAMYERCPDCWSDECQKRGRCRDVPLSHAGKIAQAALTPNELNSGAAEGGPAGMEG